MATLSLDGVLFKSLVQSGCQSLINDIDRINALNVFPVPDGDTGTNMRMTLDGGLKIIASEEETSLAVISKKLARAMTMSARGNSGVILSQYFKGLSIGFEGKDTVDALGLLEGFEAAVKQSYKVVSNPTEGTMLTVMREAAEVCRANVDSFSNIEDVFACYIKEAHASLERTPDLLACLKEAGVIDSGGAGFNRIIEGMISALDGNILVEQEAAEAKAKSEKAQSGYDVTVVLQLAASECFDMAKLSTYLQMVCDKTDVAVNGDLVKVSVHTLMPGKVLSNCQKYGDLVSVNCEFLAISQEAANDMVKKFEREHKEFATVAVASGEGLAETFKEMGCDEIVLGGQTMNPSSEDFIKAFDSLNADNIIVFPNNGNIIMAAKQAAECYDKANVVVIETKSLAQCYSALTMLDYSSGNIEEIIDNYQMVIENVTSASVTYSIRDALINGVEIKKDDYMAIVNGEIVAANANKIELIKQLFANVEDMEDKEVITLIYGQDMAEDEKESIVSFLKSTYRRIEIGEIDGSQPVYDVIISIE